MSTYLWKYYFKDDIESFRHLLANATYYASANTKPSTHGAGGSPATAIGSPGRGLGSSPTWSNKSRPVPNGINMSAHKPSKASESVMLSRADINARDSFGITLLHYISSSAAANAPSYALALLDLPLLDLYIQDFESGWTALHRALYFGNITIARALMDRDNQDAIGHSATSISHNAGGLIKIKDKEGNSPFDVFGTTIANRVLRHGTDELGLPSNSEDGENDNVQGEGGENNGEGSVACVITSHTCLNGEELFTFGSNKNLNLGFGDEDDRQYPERITLRRPESLLRRFHKEHSSHSPFSLRGAGSPNIQALETLERRDLPASAQFKPIVIRDVQISKLHTVVLTTDPEANLYVCGFGPGGRLGIGDETTRFQFVCVQGGGLHGKKIVNVGLGQNHTIAVSSEGEVFSWGNNVFGQLGYSVPNSINRDEEPLQLLPRQIYGPLKRETVIGAAASRTHSIVHTQSSLYTFGKNDGQLGLVDSDARSLEIQVAPRKVAASLFSAQISMVSAIDRATICLLDNHDVWVFANYGHTKMSFPTEGFSNYFLKHSYSTTRYDNAPNHITKITSGGDTICAMARMGDVFTVTINQIHKAETGSATASTTNPVKIRGAVSSPQRVWSLKKGHMAVRDVDVGQDGSIIICTDSGSVWKRVKRAKIKDANAPLGSAEYKPKDYKFSRIPGLTRITAVRSNTFGAYAAIRRDCDVLKTQVEVSSNRLWADLFPLLPFHRLSEEDSDAEEPAPRFWTPHEAAPNLATIRHAVLTSRRFEDELQSAMAVLDTGSQSGYDLLIGTTSSSICIPCHEFVLAGRSGSIQSALERFRQSYFFNISEILTIEYDKNGRTLILFQGVHLLTVFNLVLYVYTDAIVDVWHHTRYAPQMAGTYRQVRTELMKIASHLELRILEQAVRLMTEPSRTLHQDLERAIIKPGYLDTGDVDVEIEGSTLKVHSALICQRCPFFEGLFNGRAAGLWLSSRRETLQEPHDAITVDLKHVSAKVFKLVLRHLYADTGEELFDDVVMRDSDEFLDFIVEVLSVANELMLERLAQICQKILGRFVTIRNVCSLLNAVAPCSITEFKEAALEYICLNLEGMLENHLLNELDDDLMLELDDVVRQNQLACLPIVKSGRAGAELLERYPELISMIERGQRAKADSMSLQSRLHEDELRFASSKARANKSNNSKSSSSAPGRISAREGLGGSRSPSLRPETSANDLIFVMEDDVEDHTHEYELTSTRSNNSRYCEKTIDHESQSRALASSFQRDDMWFATRGKAFSPVADGIHAVSGTGAELASPSERGIQTQRDIKPKSQVRNLSKGKKPWVADAFTSPKLNMKDIMAQASLNRQSNIASGLSFNARPEEFGGVVTNRMTQKERKKYMLQQQQRQQSPISAIPTVTSKTRQQETLESPWQIGSRGAKVSLKDVLREIPGQTMQSSRLITRAPSFSGLTLRQTVPGNAEPAINSFVPQASLLQPQHRSISTPNATKDLAILSSSKPTSQPPPLSRQSHRVSSTPIPALRSVRHQSLPAEPSLQLSMADILSQQQAEKDVIREAAAKRSLQEIQEEQAFQEWWDQESRKVMEEEETRNEKGLVGEKDSRGAGTRGRKEKGRGGSGNGRGRGRGRGAEKGSTSLAPGRGGATKGGRGSAAPAGG